MPKLCCYSMCQKVSEHSEGLSLASTTLYATLEMPFGIKRNFEFIIIITAACWLGLLLYSVLEGRKEQPGHVGCCMSSSHSPFRVEIVYFSLTTTFSSMCVCIQNCGMISIRKEGKSHGSSKRHTHCHTPLLGNTQHCFLLIQVTYVLSQSYHEQTLNCFNPIHRNMSK